MGDYTMRVRGILLDVHVTRLMMFGFQSKKNPAIRHTFKCSEQRGGYIHGEGRYSLRNLPIVDASFVSSLGTFDRDNDDGLADRPLGYVRHNKASQDLFYDRKNGNYLWTGHQLATYTCDLLWS